MTITIITSYTNVYEDICGYFEPRLPGFIGLSKGMIKQ